ncbi:SnoaL-like domain-containing protein [Chitinophagaceae bacterium MMS25-I14]
MTTQEIANRYHELANQNKWDEILEELHDDHVICREPEHVASRGIPVVTQGKEAVKAKGAANREMIVSIHEQYCSKPVVAGNFFSVALKRDVTFKNRPRVQLEEIGVFQVKDGKIILEQFFY